MNSWVALKQVVELWRKARANSVLCSRHALELKKVQDFDSLLQLCLITRHIFANLVALAVFDPTGTGFRILVGQVLAAIGPVLPIAAAIASKLTRERDSKAKDACAYVESITFRRDMLQVLSGQGVESLRDELQRSLEARFPEPEERAEAGTYKPNQVSIQLSESFAKLSTLLFAWAAELDHEIGPYPAAVEQHGTIGSEFVELARSQFAAVEEIADGSRGEQGEIWSQLWNVVETLDQEIVTPLKTVSVAKLGTEQARVMIDSRKDSVLKWARKSLIPCAAVAALTVINPALNLSNPRDRDFPMKQAESHSTSFVPSAILVSQIIGADSSRDQTGESRLLQEPELLKELQAEVGRMTSGLLSVLAQANARNEAVDWSLSVDGAHGWQFQNDVARALASPGRLSLPHGEDGVLALRLLHDELIALSKSPHDFGWGTLAASDRGGLVMRIRPNAASSLLDMSHTARPRRTV